MCQPYCLNYGKLYKRLSTIFGSKWINLGHKNYSRYGGVQIRLTDTMYRLNCLHLVVDTKVIIFEEGDVSIDDLLDESFSIELSDKQIRKYITKAAALYVGSNVISYEPKIIYHSTNVEYSNGIGEIESYLEYLEEMDKDKEMVFNESN